MYDWNGCRRIVRCNARLSVLSSEAGHHVFRTETCRSDKSERPEPRCLRCCATCIGDMDVRKLKTVRFERTQSRHKSKFFRLALNFANKFRVFGKVSLIFSDTFLTHILYVNNTMIHEIAETCYKHTDFFFVKV